MADNQVDFNIKNFAQINNNNRERENKQTIFFNKLKVLDKSLSKQKKNNYTEVISI